ncbi:hypothetical protein D0T53_13295 [Dysgonomonas sp. 216]|uniref:hypothetical protein n=1 Tax=Dysgonomonas sp. 216 TaxID=2302934 RepID=UPI0013D375C5|nr:hypothetical protein [Dysgonomonas sp. 216]NDW19874.1 hypothetical protein [Dysgonomonas sp. 216]
MYSKSRNIVIGFHGCDKETRDKIVLGTEPMKIKKNIYDWLGWGLYFWENNYERALDWAIEKQERDPDSIKEPAVLGAFIDLGNCLDLIDTKYLKMLPAAYNYLVENIKISGVSELPQNKNIPGNFDLLKRNLDCQVIQTVHALNELPVENKDNGTTEKIKYSPFDTVRGVFWEGDELYPGAGFKEKNHIQISIINFNCIKGFFIPRSLEKTFVNP